EHGGHRREARDPVRTHESGRGAAADKKRALDLPGRKSRAHPILVTYPWAAWTQGLRVATTSGPRQRQHGKARALRRNIITIEERFDIAARRVTMGELCVTPLRSHGETLTELRHLILRNRPHFRHRAHVAGEIEQRVQRRTLRGPLIHL